jgi:NAD(P)H-dependent flavin oxidoreductase YrpB (nitropropane dioxygenase family)
MTTMHALPELPGLNLASPVLAAPMAGGATTPALVIAAARAGGLGFLAGGYKTAVLLAEQIREVRAGASVFGVNLFAPNPVPVDPAAFREYAAAIAPEGDKYGLDLRQARLVEDDDGWQEKVDLLLADPVPVVSFTFGLPPKAVISALRRAGTLILQTVTSAAEAGLAADAGVDALVVQGSDAGAHLGTFTPDPPARSPLPELVSSVRAVTGIGVVAAGGISTPDAVAEALRAGASAVMVGTVLLRSDESGASQVHKAALGTAALGTPGVSQTVLTRAFTGRFARALPNAFTRAYSPIAPAGYPALHHLTSGLRKAAAADGNAELVHLWAGTGYRGAVAGPSEEIMKGLAEVVN